MAFWDDLSRFAGNMTGGFIGESDEERRRKQQKQHLQAKVNAAKSRPTTAPFKAPGQPAPRRNVPVVGAQPGESMAQSQARAPRKRGLTVNFDAEKGLEALKDAPGEFVGGVAEMLNPVQAVTDLSKGIAETLSYDSKDAKSARQAKNNLQTQHIDLMKRAANKIQDPKTDPAERGRWQDFVKKQSHLAGTNQFRDETDRVEEIQKATDPVEGAINTVGTAFAAADAKGVATAVRDITGAVTRKAANDARLDQAIKGGGVQSEAPKSLADEAKEYATVDDFLKSKINAYHGTAAKFDRFKIGDASNNGRGVYFSNKREIAEAYASKGGSGATDPNNRLIEAYVDMKKPLSGYESTLEPEEIRKLVKAVDPSGTKIPRKWVEAVVKGKPEDVFVVNQIFGRSGMDIGEFNDLLRKTTGHDGVVGKDPGGLGKLPRDAREIVAFNPDQIMTKEQLTEIYEQAHGKSAVDKEAVLAQLEQMRAGGKQEGYVEKAAPVRDVSPETLLARATDAGMTSESAVSLMSKYGRNKFAIMLDQSNGLKGATNPNGLAASVLSKIPDGDVQVGGVAAKNDLQPLDANPAPNAEMPEGIRPVEAPATPAPQQTVEAATPVDTPLGTIAQSFYDAKKGDQAIKFRDLEAVGKQVASEIDRSFKAIGSNFSGVARKVETARREGVRDINGVDLTPDELELWLRTQDEMNYMRRRAGLGKREMGQGDAGDMYFPNQRQGDYATRDTLFEGFRATKPGNEFKRKDAITLDELTFSPEVVGGYITRYGDTKLIQAERIYRAIEKAHPELDEQTIREAADDVIALQSDVNNLKSKITLGGLGRHKTHADGKAVDFAGRMADVGRKLGNQQRVVNETPTGLTNGEKINSVLIDGVPLGDVTGLNQLHDAASYAGTHTVQAAGDREALAQMVSERLTGAYRLPEDDVAYLVESVARIKSDVPEEVVAARIEGIYRIAGKQQLMESLQHLDIRNNRLRKEVSDLANQMVREGSIEQQLSTKVVQATLRTTNALFRKLNVSSALNELSDLTSFVSVYGADTKALTPDFALIKEFNLGELDPAIEPYLKQLDEGQDVHAIVKAAKKANEATRFYKFIETYKAGVLLKTARDFYARPENGGLVGDELTAKVLEDYRRLALPVDAFTKTFFNNAPLFTQYLSWGARNIQKEGRLAMGKMDAGVLKDKSQAARVARNLYANLPAKTVFWLASNGLKGTAIMTAVGLTDFTGMTSQDYSGIAEEDKSAIDRAAQFTNISTMGSLANSVFQAYEKEKLKEEYKDEDYNPYENTSLITSVANTFTPQVYKNIRGGEELRTKGYSENAGGRIQYQAPDDVYNWVKAYAFGKNQTENAREYSGRENLVDRVNEGTNPVKAVADMAREQIGQKTTDYTRPLVASKHDKSYNELAKEAFNKVASEKGANSKEAQEVMKRWIGIGRAYNGVLDKFKKENPEDYKKWEETFDENIVSPEKWSIYRGNPKVFEFMKKRKELEEKDLGRVVDPIFKLSPERAKMVLQVRSMHTGDDMKQQSFLYKTDWYEQFKADEDKYGDTFGDDMPEKGPRHKEWTGLSKQLYAAKDMPEFNLVKELEGFEYGSEAGKAWLRANYDAWKAQKDAYDAHRLDIVNKMRKIEGVEPLSKEQFTAKIEFESPEDSSGSSGSKKGYYDKDGNWVAYGRRGGSGGRSSGGSGSNPPNTGVASTITELGNQGAGMKLPTGPKGKIKNLKTVVKTKRAKGSSPIRIKI